MVDAHTAELVASGLLVASALGGMEVGEWAPAMGSWASRKTVEWKKTKEVADWVVALKALPESVGLDGSRVAATGGAAAALTADDVAKIAAEAGAMEVLRDSIAYRGKWTDERCS
eukprot:gene1857-2527_t